jgi:serine/threonine-protein kinase HipA
MKFDPKKLKTLSVQLHGEQVGVITRLAGDQQIFAFEQNYIDNQQRSTLSLSFKNRTGGLVTYTRPVVRRVPAFFSNLLPEGQLRQYLAARADVDSEREFFLLAVLGADLPGALVVSPVEDNEAQLVNDQHADPGSAHDLGNKEPLRFSLAGVQLKFSAVIDASGGLTIPADGLGGSWIIKLPSLRFDSVPENEFAMLALARQVGIAVPETKLIDIADIKGIPDQTYSLQRKALAVKRFDRVNAGKPVHMEDFAQVFAEFPNNKYKFHSYANIASVLWAEIGEQAVIEFVRRLVFSVIIGNADMHLKNWSLLYPDRRTPVLSPGYDFVSTLPYIPNDKLALSFGDSRSLSEITPDQMRRFADAARVPMSPLWRIAVEIAERTAQAWKTLEQAAVLPNKLKEAIGNQILSVAAQIK